MMANIYGVCNIKALLRKGYSDFVQQILGKEKGNAANVALWMSSFFNHEENQYSPDLGDGGSANLLYEKNQRLAVQQDSHAEIIGVNYESFVGQLSGVSLGFLRCSALSLRPQASSTQDEKFTPGLSAFSRSTLESISSINSCGKRIPFVADLLFTARVAIEQSPNCARTPYRKFNGKKSIDVPQHLDLKCPNTLNVKWCKIAKPGSAGTLTGLLTKPLSEVTIMACSHDTQTRPKFVFLFLASYPSGGKPIMLRTEADSESEARIQVAGDYSLTFAAQIRTESPCVIHQYYEDADLNSTYVCNKANAHPVCIAGKSSHCASVCKPSLNSLPAPGDLYTQNEGGMSAIVRAFNGGRVVFSYEQYPSASHDYSLEGFMREFTCKEAGHA